MKRCRASIGNHDHNQGAVLWCLGLISSTMLKNVHDNYFILAPIATKLVHQIGLSRRRLVLWWFPGGHSNDKRGYHTRPWTPGGGTFAKFVRGCGCQTLKIWLFLYQFFAWWISNSSVYILERKGEESLLKLGAFCYNLLKLHPIYVSWFPSSFLKTH